MSRRKSLTELGVTRDMADSFIRRSNGSKTSTVEPEELARIAAAENRRVCECAPLEPDKKQRMIGWVPCRRCGAHRMVSYEQLMARPLLTPTELAVLLPGRTPDWVREMARSAPGLLPHLRPMKRSPLVRIEPAAVQAWQRFSRRAHQSEKPFNGAHLSTSGFVYYIQAEIGGPIKIGKADDVRERLSALQLSSPFQLRELASELGGERLERELHHRFAPYRLHGEWFYEKTPHLKARIRRARRKAAR